MARTSGARVHFSRENGILKARTCRSTFAQKIKLEAKTCIKREESEDVQKHQDGEIKEASQAPVGKCKLADHGQEGRETVSKWHGRVWQPAPAEGGDMGFGSEH